MKVRQGAQLWVRAIASNHNDRTRSIRGATSLLLLCFGIHFVWHRWSLEDNHILVHIYMYRIEN